MGGFAGGDEGGYWDIDTLPAAVNQHTKTHKVNSYIEATDAGYSIKAHAKAKNCSRWILMDELYDTISFVSCTSQTFTIEGCDNIPLESNTIYKAYQALLDYTNDSDIADFFYTHKVVVIKRIPPSAGLGGSSSDAASFICLVKEACNLVLSTDELAKIGSLIHDDVPFFIHLIT